MLYSIYPTRWDNTEQTLLLRTDKATDTPFQLGSPTPGVFFVDTDNLAEEIAKIEKYCPVQSVIKDNDIVWIKTLAEVELPPEPPPDVT